MLDDSLTVAVPGDAEAVEPLKSRLEELGVGGWIIDGADVAYPGWVLARVVGHEDLTTDDLRDRLTVTWPDVRVDEVEVANGSIVGPAGPSPAEPLHEVGVARTRGLGLDFEAEFEEVRLAEVRTGERSVFARVQPFEGADHELIEVFTTAKRGSVVLHRRGGRVVLHVLRRSKAVELHVWEPCWTPVGGEDFDKLRRDLLPSPADAAQILTVLELPPESIGPLRALMSRESPPLDELCEILELPTEALRVISGECAVEGLPGAVVHEPPDAADSDVGFGWRDLIVLPLSLFVFGGGIVRWLNGGAMWWGVLAAIGMVLTIKNLVDRWIKRRRS
ncbi:hypothetical protein [Aeromicrobium sp. P5_D10]